MSDERLARYREEVVRLETLVEEHTRDRSRIMKFLWGLLLCPLGLFVHPLAALGIAFVVLSLFFCGLYLSSMHYWDRKEQLERARRELRKLAATDG